MKIDYTLESLQLALRIDRHSLEVELEQQPLLFHKVGEKYAEALSIRDYLKKDMEEEAAKIDATARQNALDQEIKITEKQVEYLIKCDESYKTKAHEYLDAKEDADKWKALLDSFEQRSYALKDLVALWIGGYWVSSDSPRTNIHATRGAVEDMRGILNKERLKRRDSG